MDLRTDRPLRVTLVVLGDFGRSPRMQYHAALLAREGADIDVIALRGKPPMDELAANGRVALHLIPALESLAWLPAAVVRMAIHSVWMAALMLVAVRRPDVVLVQNPPAFPAIPLALLFGRVSGAAVIVDWHNLTSAMAALRVRSTRIRALLQSAEEAAGRRADAALAVSEPLRDHLAERKAANAVVFPDAPWPGPHEPDRRAGRALLARIAGSDFDSFFAITATSWSADEEMEWIIDAAAIADSMLPNGRTLSIVATGDGPRRQAFENRLRASHFDNVRIATAWLDSGDFRDALAAADVGICLHRSASGLDFPMKIADMRGAALPICVLDCGAKSMREEVRKNGGVRFFTTPATLAGHLAGFAADRASLESFRNEVPSTLATWDEEWRRVVEPLVIRLATT